MMAGVARTEQDDLRDLCVRMLDGDVQARNTLVERHAWVVNMHVRSYASPWGSDLDDLRQVGMLGLMRACRSYSLKHDVRFSTYAAYWVRAYMQRATERRVGTRSTFIPTQDRVIDERGKRRHPRAEIVSLHAPSSEGSERLLEEEVADLNATSPEDDVASSEARRIVMAAVGRMKLDTVDTLIVYKRILGDPPCTLRQIGDRVGLSREAIRLREVRVLAHLRDTVCAITHRFAS
jgi:RNA polymerase primary sigma factor